MIKLAAMAKIQKPEKNWIEKITPDLMRKSVSSIGFESLLQKGQKEYLYWDKFKYLPMPESVSPIEAWAFLKLRRMSLYQNTPVRTIDGTPFVFAMVNTLSQKMNFIDMHAASFVKTVMSDAQNNKFILSGLTEEAIATSQIEGANTSRKIAKEMLASQRPPKTKSEQMIINSYEMMQKLSDWKDFELSEEMLLEIQSIVTEKTLDDPKDKGRFRTDADGIVVKDPNTEEVVYVPPEEALMKKELKRLIEFANKPEVEVDGEFIHPVIKATLLHFWVAYLHPFVDGNGRTARAVFHWYLLKHGYWLVQYLSISRAIVHSRKKYDNVFIYSENENDVTYFLSYIADAFKIAIDKFLEYFKEKMEETEEFTKVAIRLDKEYNPRQIALLRYFLETKKSFPADVAIHRAKHGVSRPTAYNDLADLAQKGVLVQVIRGKRHIYMPNMEAIKKVFRKK